MFDTSRTARRVEGGGWSLSIAHALADLVLPGGCVACSAHGGALCRTCRMALAGPAHLTRPVPAPEGLPITWTTSAYEGAPRAAILAHKEHGRLALARPLGEALALAALAALAADGSGSADLAVVPMPSRAAARRARGHDPMRRIGGSAAQVLRASRVVVDLLPVLRTTRRLADQAGLDSAARAANLSGALVVPDRFRRLVSGRRALIVDDVVTTGASLAEAARALLTADADVIGAAVIAATTRRGPPKHVHPALAGRQFRGSVSLWHPPGSVVASD